MASHAISYDRPGDGRRISFELNITHIKGKPVGRDRMNEIIRFFEQELQRESGRIRHEKLSDVLSLIEKIAERIAGAITSQFTQKPAKCWINKATVKVRVQETATA